MTNGIVNRGDTTFSLFIRIFIGAMAIFAQLYASTASRLPVHTRTHVYITFEKSTFIMLLSWQPHRYFISIQFDIRTMIVSFRHKIDKRMHSQTINNMLRLYRSFILLHELLIHCASLLCVFVLFCSVLFVCLWAQIHIHSYMLCDALLGMNTIFHLWAFRPNQHPCAHVVYETI